MILDAEDIRNYCIAKKCVTEGFPFDETSLVFKVCNKMFAILSLDDSFSINLKCNPEKAYNFAKNIQKLRRVII